MLEGRDPLRCEGDATTGRPREGFRVISGGEKMIFSDKSAGLYRRSLRP